MKHAPNSKAHNGGGGVRDSVTTAYMQAPSRRYMLELRGFTTTTCDILVLYDSCFHNFYSYSMGF